MKNDTIFDVDRDDMFHLAHLLRDDMQFSYDCIKAAPFSDAAEESMISLKRSKSLLRKITDHVLEHSYEPEPMATRPDLN